MAKIDNRDVKKFKKIAKEIRKEIIRVIYNAKAHHIGPSFSSVEILVALYFKCLNVSPHKTHDRNRDRFILSKGHACPALYAILAKKGFLSPKTLKGFARNDGTLEEHPSLSLKKGIECTSGSLGHGLSIGAGMALAAKRDNISGRIFVLLGDGETESGSVWEAAMLAAHHKLDNLVAIIDYNKMQALGRVSEVINMGQYDDKWSSFGWEARDVDGHDFRGLLPVFKNIPFKKGKPSVIIAHTVKGKGVSFMENNLLWHYRCPDEKEYAKALKELE
jgi:transketolase